MRTTIPRERRRWWLYLSERSGFKYFRRELVKDKGNWVHPTEMDEPPPYNKYIGGEGETNSGNQRTDRNSFPTTKQEIYNP